MVAKDSQDEHCHLVRSHRQRLVLFEPEVGWWIHAVIANETILVPPASSSKSSSNSSKPGTPVQATKLEPAQSDKGLTDQVLQESIEAGYADFVLLNGTFATILESRGRPALERAMERFWTRWAWEWGVTLEDSAGVSKSLQGLPVSTIPPQDFDKVLDAYQATLPASVTPVIIGPAGPLTSSPTPSLTRYFYHILARSLPPKPVKAEGEYGTPGRRSAPEVKPRVSSWNPFSKSAWLPTSTSAVTARGTSNEKAKANEGKNRWPSLGLGSVTTGMESVGAVFGMGGRETPSAKEAVDIDATSQKAARAPDTVPLPESPKEEANSEAAAATVQTRINVDDLEEAISEAEARDETLPWTRQVVWLPRADDEVVRHSLAWIMREDILLVLITPPDDPCESAEFPTRSTLDLLAAVSKLVAEQSITQLGSKTSGPSTVTTIHSQPTQNLVDVHPANGLSSVTSTADQELSELRGLLHDTDTLEVLARTQESKFLAAKKSDVPGGGDALVFVNRSDASIVDAEHALRVFAKSHPEFAS